ncbi:NADP-dependent phosphogluconate dehydrogenase [Garciella nitratireducens]|uniref:NADP-dependent phosphogluconate dehydrogenase n=1 Tax=Garciella nitratireducens TaxID=218205 RepID=UPI001BD38BA9|nr:NADP-dependent phosphogluconate dehydrogenase [Garciella nitratireducens]
MRDIGIFGLGIMGSSLALNMAHKGIKVSVYDWISQETKNFVENKLSKEDIIVYYDIKSFIESLKKPRIVYLLIKSGKPVDNMIEKLLPYLEEGDLIIDGGNEHYLETSRRMQKLKKKKVFYLGVGISGGESGALNGPSFMPGGDREGYERVEEILLKVAAQTDLGPCCTYIGKDSAGHFVKMVHNGIEYGMMQAIAETYDILRKILHLSPEQIGQIFKKWNEEELSSFLMEISSEIMKYRDEETKEYLVDLILDKAEQKGTGKWTVQAALDLGIPTPSLNAAVEARILSYFKEERKELSKKFSKEKPLYNKNKKQFIKDLKNALLFTNLMIFSQGLWLIAEASKEYNYDIDLLEVLRIWRGGCIIRAKIIDFIREILKKDKANVNLLKNEKVITFITEKIPSVQEVVNVGRNFCVPTLVHNTALDYFYSMISEKLPANLIQSQRDFFGAHTYSRVDKEGVFHSYWK